MKEQISMNMTNYLSQLIALLLVLSLMSCQETPKPNIELKRVSFKELPNWDKDSIAEVWPAFLRSCARVKDAQLKPVCSQALTLPGDISESQIRIFFETHFIPYQVTTQNSEEGLFTGYYEPVLSGSYTQSAEYSAPLFKRPDDLVMIENLGIFRENLKGVRIAGRINNGQLIPYYTHEEIDQGALQGYELLWVDDPIDAFFAQIQGSAVVQLDNNDYIRISYAGTNGHSYTPIGKVLIADKELTKDTVSMQSIRAWLNTHPEQMKDLLYKNESFVFFKTTQGAGPIGAQGVVLTPGRSLAIDPNYMDLGTPVWLDISHPQQEGTRIQKLVIAQDTGGAIKGPIRGDLFWGTGVDAGVSAGMMKSTGYYYVLLPKIN